MQSESFSPSNWSCEFYSDEVGDLEALGTVIILNSAVGDAQVLDLQLIRFLAGKIVSYEGKHLGI